MRAMGAFVCNILLVVRAVGEADCYVFHVLRAIGQLIVTFSTL